MTRIGLRFFYALYSIFFCLSLNAQNKFSERSHALGFIFEYGYGTPTGGISFADFNQDGWDDITIASAKGKQIGFFLNEGGTFKRLPSLVDNTDVIKQVLWADFDNDGDQDLFVTGHDAQNHLYENSGNLVLTDITETAGLSFQAEPNYGAAWGDYNRDGYLDLFINIRIDDAFVYSSNRLYLNTGSKTFIEVTEEYGLQDATKAPFCASFVDHNNDMWPDLFIAQDKKTGNDLFQNKFGTDYPNISDRCQADIDMFAMSVAVGDYDQNGFEDIYVTNTVGSKMMKNTSHGIFIETARESNTEFRKGIGWGANFVDTDNDLDLDLYVSGMLEGSDAVSSQFYENRELGNFLPILDAFPGDTISSFANAIGDIDNDGLMDIAVVNNQFLPAHLWSNENTTNAAWIKIELEGTWSNKDGIGARIELFQNGERYMKYTYSAIGFLAQNSSRYHFGLAGANKADSVHIYWPSGHIDKHYDLEARQTHSLLEGSTSALVPELVSVGKANNCSGELVRLHAGLFSTLFNYQWSTGETTPIIEVEQTGKYSVVITGPGLEGGTWQSDEMEIVVSTHSPISFSSNISDISCAGASDGRIEILLNDNKAEYTFLWSNGKVSPSIKDLEPGFYHLQISNGTCAVNETFYMREPDPLLVESTITHSTNLNGNGIVRAEVFGGNRPYQYEWASSSHNSSQLSGLDAGWESLVIVDANGCEIMHDFLVTSAYIDPVTSAEDNVLGEFVSAYPNPTSSHVDINLGQSFKNGFELSVANGMGQLSGYHQTFPPGYYQSVRLDSRDLSMGLNLIIIRDSSGSNKLIKVIKTQ